MILPFEPLPGRLDAPGSSFQPKAGSESSAMHCTALSTSLCSATAWLAAPGSPRSFHSSTLISSTCPSIKTHVNSTFFYKHSNISLFPVVLCTRFIIALPPPWATWRQDYIYNVFTEWTIEWTNESVKGELKTENTNACQPFTMSA